LVAFHRSKTPQLINGIVLLNSEKYKKSFTKPFSHDSKNPNYGYSYYRDKPGYNRPEWNAAGTSFFFQNINVPIYIVTNDTEIDSIQKCYDDFNRNIFFKYFNSTTESTKIVLKSDDRLCGMQLGIQMFSGGNSKICLRRNTIKHVLEDNTFCDPLGGANYYNYLSLKPASKLPLVVVNTRIDSFTMFDYYTPAANEPITSIISLMAIADLLSEYRSDFDLKDILFVLMDNDAFDYGGSHRFVNDLQSGQLEAGE
jgi:hypothetical protein